jgi:outer membrane protein assembly factor BamD
MMTEFDIQCTTNSEDKFGQGFLMKITKIIALSCTSLLVCLLAACASSTDPADAYKGETAQQIFQGGEESLRGGSYSDAIKHFEALDVQYPFGRDTETAQLHIIYAYYKNSDFLSAETAADRFIHAYPTSPNVAYAYYMRGLASYYQNMGIFERMFSVDYATRDLTQVKKAFNDFSELETRYPQSPYAPAAHQYMIYLRNVLANHQIEVAQFYFNRQAYVASANRASMVVEHYQGAPVVPDALVIMVKSYHQLRQTDLENQAQQVLNLNYPDSIYVREVSGKELNSPKVMIAPRQQKPLPPEPKQAFAPPTSATTNSWWHASSASSTSSTSSARQAQTNGMRGSTTTVADIVQEMRKNSWVKPKSATPAATPSSAPARTTSVRAQQAVVKPVQQAAAPAVVADNSKKSGTGMTLADVANLMNGHSDTTTPVAPAQATPLKRAATNTNGNR